MTFKILSEEGKIIHQSIVQLAAMEGVHRNKQADENAKDTTVSKGTEPYTTIQPEDVVLSRWDDAISDRTSPSMD